MLYLELPTLQLTPYSRPTPAKSQLVHNTVTQAQLLPKLPDKPQTLFVVLPREGSQRIPLPSSQAEGMSPRQLGYPPEMQVSPHFLEALPSFPTPLQFSQDSATRSFLTVSLKYSTNRIFGKVIAWSQTTFPKRSQIKEI